MRTIISAAIVVVLSLRILVVFYRKYYQEFNVFFLFRLRLLMWFRKECYPSNSETKNSTLLKKKKSAAARCERYYYRKRIYCKVLPSPIKKYIFAVILANCEEIYRRLVYKATVLGVESVHSRVILLHYF